MMYQEILKATQAVSVASAELDQPRLRLMTLICMDKRLFLATGSGDAKTKQWAINPKLECLLPITNNAGNGYLRICGSLKIVQDLALKKSVADHAPFIYNYWQYPANPDYVLFEINVNQWRYLMPGEDKEEVFDR